MWIEVSTVGDVVDRRAEISEQVALVMPGTRLTYPQLSELTDRYAAGLLALGVGRGDKVGILLPNTVDYVASVIGAAKLGAVAVPINGRFKSYELGHVIAHGDVRVLVTGSDPNGTDYPALLTEVLPALAAADPALPLQLDDAPVLRAVLDLSVTTPGMTTPGMLTRDDFDRLAATIDRAEVKKRQARVRVRDIALLMYTSGTTARPKGCLLTHEAVTRHSANVARTRFHLTDADSFWDPLPMFHCGGLIPMLGCFAVGAKYCHPTHFEPTAALRTMAEERCTVLYPAFETIWLAVLGHPDFASTDLSAVRLIQNIATPKRLAQYEARMPWARQVTSYGSTESATNLTLPLPDDAYEVRMGTHGRPIEGMELKVVDPDSGTVLPPDTMGEICFRGYAMFEGYYKDAATTDSAIDVDGWFHTGDRARIDPAGNVVYGGRLKDMLKVGGENVAAIEIEDYLARHPGVAIAQVIGVPDARYGEVPAAYIQPVPDSGLTTEQVLDFCLGQIATFKVPRYVRFVAEWPMSGTKIKKYELRATLLAELAAAGTTEAPRLSVPRVQSAG